MPFSNLPGPFPFLLFLARQTEGTAQLIRAVTSRLRLIEQWSDSTNVHTLYLVQKAPLDFPSTLPLSDLFKEADEVVASGSEKVVAEVKENFFGLPSLDDWEAMWKAWDLITVSLLSLKWLKIKY